MKTHKALLSSQAALLGLSLTLAGCSGGGGSGSGDGSMYIQSCSLGCGNAVNGSPIGCSLVNISQNAEVTIQFSKPVNISTVTSGSFRLVNLNDGTVPSGVFTRDPADSRRLIFRPSLTFTGAGNPEFGFDPNETYEIRILGEGQDGAGPFIQSAAGKNNQTRMTCTVQTTEPLVDPVPGPPTLTAYVTDVLNPVTGAVMFNPTTNLPVGGVPLNGATELKTKSKVVLIFDDVMHKATVANQLNGQSNTITVQVDADGDLNTPDLVFWPGIWTVDVDFDNLLRTVAIFTPNGGEFPTGGGNPAQPRKVLVTVTNQLLDIVGNALENPSLNVFSTETQPFEEEVLTEDFTTSDNEDTRASGGAWGGGRLTYGSGGGSGRLGPLVLGTGETLTLDTDSQEFPLPGHVESIMSNLDPGVDYDPADDATWPTVTIDQLGQAFEFSHVSIAGGARLILTGSQAGRIFSRGELVVDGVIDLTGETPEPHKSNSGGTQDNNTLADGLETIDGGPGGSGGPAAGAGGQGADRMDMGEPGTTVPLMVNIGGCEFPVGHAPASNSGRAGGGVGGLPTGTGGVGGVNWPSQLPRHNSPNTGGALYGDAEMSAIVDDGNVCRVAMVGGPGSGGSHAFPGGVGMPNSPYVPATPQNNANIPASTPGGDNSALDLEAPGTIGATAKRNLEFWRKHLRGGSGGGGGGAHIWGSKHNSATGPNCSQNGGLFPFFDHSAAGGGGGGGAAMLTAGSRLRINGQVDCSGGDGGSSTLPGAAISLCTQSGQLLGEAPDCEKYAAPGGAGAGGSVRLQGDVVEFSAVPSRIVVAGGLGGQGVGGSIGGDGSPGLVRIEYNGFVSQVADAQIFAPLVTPFDEFAGTGPGELNEFSLSGGILSIGEWEDQTFRPESFSGSQSCWLEVPSDQGSFFGLSFVGDVAGPPTDLDNFGWNMDVIYDHPGLGELIYPYRGIPPVDAGDQYDEANFPAAELGGDDFQTYLGTTLNHDEPTLSTGSLFVVRFQGVRLSGTATDLCNLNLNGSSVEPDSLTPWVDHPTKLNLFIPQPNVIRFAVVFDEQLAQYDPVIAGRLRGVTNLRIRVQPN